MHDYTVTTITTVIFQIKSTQLSRVFIVLSDNIKTSEATGFFYKKVIY